LIFFLFLAASCLRLLGGVVMAATTVFPSISSVPAAAAGAAPQDGAVTTKEQPWSNGTVSDRDRSSKEDNR